MKLMAKDRRTRFTGVYARHKQGCAIEAGAKCSCKPSFWGQVWDSGRYRKTRFYPTPSAAKNARVDLLRAVRAGALPSDSMRVEHAITAFLKAAEQGIARNKHGRRYKPSALRDLRGALEGQVKAGLGRKRIADVRRGDVQRMVDQLTPKVSGSRVRTIVNAVHSLYRWAQARELVLHDPASLVQLPAMEATPRDRVASPEEMANLLGALSLTDALPFALAAYSTARRAEIRHLQVGDVELTAGLIRLGVDEHGRKSPAAMREVPIVRPLAVMLRRHLMERGRPEPSELLCPGSKPGGRNSGLLSFEALQTRADARWETAKLARITPHECRHTCASWLHAAGVPDAVVSYLIGHAEPRLAGAAVTRRYVHALPDDIANAGRLLDRYLASATKARTG